MALVHASCVAIDGRGVLLMGPSGSGKSDLALRLIDAGAALVADDQVELSAEAGVLLAAAPGPIAGRIEVRGLGILALERCPSAPVALVVDLLADGRPQRHPARALWRHDGIAVARIALAPFEASAAAKVRLAVRALAGDSGRAGAPAASAGRGPGSRSGAGR